LIREYFAKQLKDKQPAAFQAAHSRLFDHLCKTTEYQPNTLDGLQPLYQAVVHGCLAGRQQEACELVYRDRIQRGMASNAFYTIHKLGAMGADLAAVAAFFDEPWSQVSLNLSEAAQGSLFAVAGYELRALGRLTEALEPMRAGLEMAVQQRDWKNAAINASNLSDLEVTLGRLTEAVADAHRSVTYADQSGDGYQRMSKRARAADVMHQSGQLIEAGVLFAEAERMQKVRQPEFDLLYSLQGFQSCDLLLAPAEREAWQAVIRGMGVSPDPESHGNDDNLAICAEAKRRATITLTWAIENQESFLLGMAFDNLTLARVGLIRAILEHSLPQPAFDLPQVGAAVNGFRNAGTTHHLPKGLLTAALYHFVRGEHDAARARLNEAQQIAERGPMPLYLADVHLHRARLFRDRAELAKSAKLIRELGYGRRHDELADAEEAAKSWPAEGSASPTE
jgi:tetratricopeptide (TPR) repeat protein